MLWGAQDPCGGFLESSKGFASRPGAGEAAACWLSVAIWRMFVPPGSALCTSPTCIGQQKYCPKSSWGTAFFHHRNLSKPFSVSGFICSVAQSSCTVSRGPGLVYFRTQSNLNLIPTLCNSYLQQRDCCVQLCLFFKLHVVLVARWCHDKRDWMPRNLFESVALQRDLGCVLVSTKVVFFFNFAVVPKMHRNKIVLEDQKTCTSTSSRHQLVVHRLYTNLAWVAGWLWVTAVQVLNFVQIGCFVLLFQGNAV